MGKVSVTVQKRLIVLLFQFFVYVYQRRRNLYAGLDGKTQSMRLVGIVVGVLTQNNHFDLVERSAVERLKNKTSGRVNNPFCVSGFDERRQLGEIFAFELVLKHL